MTDRYALVFAIFSFVLGTIVGSFLNVVIHRLPRGMSVNEPRRSFCPACEKQIPWFYNLPLVSWIWLGGKCAFCKAPISARYFVVELLTGVLFFAVWVRFFPDWAMALCLWVLAGLLIAATFIDFEHFIIPDEITWGGAGAGFAASMLVPALHGVEVWWQGAAWAAAGAAAGSAILWLVVEAGKLAFGKYRVRSATPEEFSFRRDGEDWVLKVGDDEIRASEVCSRPSDELVILCSDAQMNGAAVESREIRLRRDAVAAGAVKSSIADVKELTGRTSELVVPREAMGLGDVKFIACIGAFLGWKAVVFTVVASSIIGAVVGVILIVLRGREKGGIIPFGPYLALGALLWVFVGPQVVQLYLDWLAGPYGG